MTKSRLTEIAVKIPLDLNVRRQCLNTGDRLGVQISSDLITRNQLCRLPDGRELGLVIQNWRIRVTRTLHRGIHLIGVIPRRRRHGGRILTFAHIPRRSGVGREHERVELSDVFTITSSTDVGGSSGTAGSLEEGEREGEKRGRGKECGGRRPDHGVELL